MNYEMKYRENDKGELHKFTGDEKHISIAITELIKKNDSMTIKISKVK
jgi:hypothetical protein